MRTFTRLNCRGAHAALTTSASAATIAATIDNEATTTATTAAIFEGDGDGDEPSERRASNEATAATSADGGEPPLHQMTFRLRNRRVEVERTTNVWASECQSKAMSAASASNELRARDSRSYSGSSTADAINGLSCLKTSSRPSDGRVRLLVLQAAPLKAPSVCRHCGPQNGHAAARRRCDRAKASAAIPKMPPIDERRGSSTTKRRRANGAFESFVSPIFQCGVRLAGMQLYDRATNSFVYTNKYEGRRFNKEQFAAAWSLFIL